MNLRNALDNFSFNDMDSNPPRRVLATFIMLPIYAGLDDHIRYGELLVHAAQQFQWDILAEGIRQEFLTLADLWQQFMAHRKHKLHDKYVVSAWALQDVRDHVRILQIIRTCSRMDCTRVPIDSIARISTAVLASQRTLEATYVILVDSFPGQDRF